MEEVVTYAGLKAKALDLLSDCGFFTFQENGEGAISINEILGMGTRVLAEVALTMQAEADAAEAEKEED